MWLLETQITYMAHAIFLLDGTDHDCLVFWTLALGLSVWSVFVKKVCLKGMQSICYRTLHAHQIKLVN